jgi:hypothetical protein
MLASNRKSATVRLLGGRGAARSRAAPDFMLEPNCTLHFTFEVNREVKWFTIEVSR